MIATLHLHALALGVSALLTAGCAPASLVDVAPVNTVVDPSVVTNASGGLQLANGAVSRFAGSLTDLARSSAMFTDELMIVWPTATRGLDERTVSPDRTYDIHSPRIRAEQARELLRAYASTTSGPLQARMLAIEGHTLVWLAELYCSGMPLSSVPILSGRASLTRGFSTQELLEQAIARFDTAATLAGDSTRYSWFAKVGRARALLALGRFADAAAAASQVPTDFVYLAELGQESFSNLMGNSPGDAQIVDSEGTNGLVWSTDPRTVMVTIPALFGAMKIAGKYSFVGGVVSNASCCINDNPIRAADGLEARLIEAEAALAAGNGSWLTTLNTLRSTCIGTAPCAPVPGLTVASLPPLTDPGTPNARLDLLMKERAMWLYLTNHREGDLRRMARVYHRDPETLWPTGVYINAGFPPFTQPSNVNGGVYGPLVVWSLLPAEAALNPLYTGCLDLNP